MFRISKLSIIIALIALFACTTLVYLTNSGEEIHQKKGKIQQWFNVTKCSKQFELNFDKKHEMEKSLEELRDSSRRTAHFSFQLRQFKESEFGFLTDKSGQKLSLSEGGYCTINLVMHRKCQKIVLYKYLKPHGQDEKIYHREKECLILQWLMLSGSPVTPCYGLIGTNGLLLEPFLVQTQDESIDAYLHGHKVGRVPSLITSDLPYWLENNLDADWWKIVEQIVEVVHVLHKKGLFYRDFKPEHILIDPISKDGILTDFNIAWFFESGFPTPLQWNTFCTPPELLSGVGFYTAESDIYCLGKLFLVMRKANPGILRSLGPLIAQMGRYNWRKRPKMGQVLKEIRNLKVNLTFE